MQFIHRLAVLSLIAGLAPADLVAQHQERSQIPEKYRWNLTEIYPDDQAWRAAKDKLAPRFRVRAFKGTLGSSAQKLADALELGSRHLEGIRPDCSLREHDVRPGHARQHLPGHAAGDGADRRQLRRRSVVHGTGDSQGRSRDDRQVHRDRTAAEGLHASTCTTSLRRARAHAERRRGKDSSPTLVRWPASPSNIYGILSDADFPYPTVTLSDGKSVKLDQAGFNDCARCPNRADREKVDVGVLRGRSAASAARSARR